MRNASKLISLTLVAAAIVVPGGVSQAGAATTIRSGTLDAHGLRRLAATAWDGGRFATASGEGVTVLVSPAYGSDSGVGQRWADFFASLVHGSELGLLTAYIAPLGGRVSPVGVTTNGLPAFGPAAGAVWSTTETMLGPPSSSE